MPTRRPSAASIARVAGAWSFAGLLALGVVGTISAASPAPEATPAPVTIADFTFDPGTITIRQHEVVSWRNDGPGSHTVTADNGGFDSGSLQAGDGFANLFDTAGTFTYHCAIHPKMTGTVVVEPVAATPEPSGPTPPPGTLPPSFNALVTPPAAATSGAAAPTASPTPASPDSGPAASLVLGLVIAGAGLAGLVFLLRRRRPKE